MTPLTLFHVFFQVLKVIVEEKERAKAAAAAAESALTLFTMF